MFTGSKRCEDRERFGWLEMRVSPSNIDDWRISDEPSRYPNVRGTPSI